MHRLVLPLAAALSLTACLDGTNPITGGESATTPPDDDVTYTDDKGTDIESDNSKEFVEEYDYDTGNGYAVDFKYDSVNDTFFVDNLAFDGDGTYARDTVTYVGETVAGELGTAQIYTADAFTSDFVTGAAIPQFIYRAIVDKSNSGKTYYMLVRTGSYRDFGYGGWIFGRKGGVVLPAIDPNDNQAQFLGDYAGLVDFDGDANLMVVTGDARIVIDLADFNASSDYDGNAVRGEITNRIYLATEASFGSDIDDGTFAAGDDVTGQFLTNFNGYQQASLTALPVLTFDVGPDDLTTDGELEGIVSAFFVDDNGNTRTFLEGPYHGVIAGEGANMEVVGVLVAEGAYGPNLTFRETGGFIAYR